MLQYGKVIIYNNQLYFGNSSNQPQSINVDLSNYVTKNEISTNLKYMFGTYTGTGTLTVVTQQNTINLGFEPKLLYMIKRQNTANENNPYVALVINLHYWNNLSRIYNVPVYIQDSFDADGNYLHYNRNQPSITIIETGFKYGMQFDQKTDYMYIVFY